MIRLEDIAIASFSLDYAPRLYVKQLEDRCDDAIAGACPIYYEARHCSPAFRMIESRF